MTSVLYAVDAVLYLGSVIVYFQEPTIEPFFLRYIVVSYSPPTVFISPHGVPSGSKAVNNILKNNLILKIYLPFFGTFILPLI